MAASKSLHPVIILLGILVLATALTWLVPPGAFEREGRLVLPDSYQELPRGYGLDALWQGPENTTAPAPVGLAGMLTAIPAGLQRGGNLIFMVMIIGGMFGVLEKARIVELGIARLIRAVRGHVGLMTILLMIVFSAGSAFLGLASEYLLVIPVMTALATRLGLPAIAGFAILTVAEKVGYIASVTNPVALTIAQPLVGVPVFSGAGLRLAIYAIFLLIGIGFMFYRLRAAAGTRVALDVADHPPPMQWREAVMLAVLTGGIALVLVGSTRWHWSHHELSAAYIGISLVLAGLSGLAAGEAADAFVSGMKKVLLASVLIGVASAVTIVLEDGRVLDTIVHGLNSAVGQHGAALTATTMFVTQLLLDVLIPSTSGQAAVTMPIMAPLAQLAGVGPQTTVSAFLLGNGITNMITPTSGTLLAYLAAGRISWTDWVRYVWPLVVIFALLSPAILAVAVAFGL